MFIPAHIVNMLRDVKGDDISSVSTVGNNASIDFELSRLREELNRAKSENINLKDKLFSATETNFDTASETGSIQGDEPKLKASFIRAQRDVVSSALTFTNHRSILGFIYR